jgi:hypothetical protein
MQTEFYSENLEEKEHLGELGVEDNIKMDLKEIGYEYVD